MEPRIVARGDESRRAGRETATMGIRALTSVGLGLFGVALLGLLLSGHTEVRVSADDEAPALPLTVVVLPIAAGLLLTRLVPPRLPALPALVDGRAALARQAYGLLGLALAYPVLLLLTGTGPWYGPLKVTVLLGGGWLILRLWRADWSGAADHRAALPPALRWLAPLPALVAWGYLYFYGPLAGDRDMSGYERYDRVYLIGAMLLTFLSASVAEEIFYRVMLQTRLEALLGRWPALVASSLLFALMHVNRLHDGPVAVMLAVIVVFNGGFGLFVGYLWARYRNLAAIIVAHGAVNSVPLIPVVLA
jgi:membrane protease YdiL (CAAX protease family)